MALRFLLPKIGRRGLSGGELKVVKCPIGLLSGVLSTFQNLRSGGNSSSVRRFCNSSRHTEEVTSDSESDLRPDPSQLRNIRDFGQDYDIPRYPVAGGGNWKMSLQMAEVGEAADLAVKLYNEQQNSKLEVVELVEAYGTVCAGWWFDLIFKAVDLDSGEIDKYEACVWLHACDKSASELSYLRRLASDES